MVQQVASIIRDDILEYCKDLPDVGWPPNISKLSSVEREYPQSVNLFLTKLLKSSEHDGRKSDRVSRLIGSYSADLIHGVSRGQVVTEKHFLMGLGLHNITGQKKVVEVLNHLGHSISYTNVCDIETAQAQKAQVLATNSKSLPVKPATPEDTILTFFWVDNFDMNVEKVGGAGAINTTHLVAFQETSDHSVMFEPKVSVRKLKRRTLLPLLEDEQPAVINPKPEPSLIKSITEPPTFDTDVILAKYLIWLFFRKWNSFDQVISSFTGWLTEYRASFAEHLVKTVTTYLPPITSKVNENKTIIKYFQYLQGLARESGMPYTNITLDVGAAMSAYKLLWNYSDIYNDVIIHLGDFHFMKENFQVLGGIVAESGFEDLVYQAGVCSSGSLLGVLSGSHYNRSWTVHSAVSEALERLLLCRFLKKGELIPAQLSASSTDPELFNSSVIDGTMDYMKRYETFRQKARTGAFGKTAQFWLIYLDLMRYQNIMHVAVQENDLNMRLFCWTKFIPFYFALNKMNYARYGSYYARILANINLLYPGAEELLEKKGMSVQAQDRYPVRTAVDQRGEQTINRDAKTAGGIKNIAKDPNAVLKWCLNRSEQASNTKALFEMANISGTSGSYKPLRPSQIVRSEVLVQSIMRVLEDEYINPYDDSIDPDSLFNLSSGVPVNDAFTKEMLQMPQRGEELYHEFVKQRLTNDSVKFHAPLTRNKFKTFRNLCQTSTVEKNNISKTVEVNRNILSTLLSFSAKTGKAIDLENALQYPLNPIPPINYSAPQSAPPLLNSLRRA